MDDGPVNLTAGWAVIWSTNGGVQGQSLLLRTILIGALLVTPGVVLPILSSQMGQLVRLVDGAKAPVTSRNGVNLMPSPRGTGTPCIRSPLVLVMTTPSRLPLTELVVRWPRGHLLRSVERGRNRSG